MPAVTIKTIHTPTNFRTIKAFFKQLERYGLNPRDWKIERRSLDARLEKVEMRHRLDEEFRLLGRVDRTREGHPIIEQMTLISI